MEQLPILKAGLRALLSSNRAESLFASARRAVRRDATQGHWSVRVEPSYYYGVWMKHLVLLHAHGMAAVPESLAEFGPGDSVGVGVAALLSGAERYTGFDASDFTRRERDQRVFEELVELFAMRRPRPMKGWPDIDPYLGPDLFPHDALGDEHLRRTLAPERIARLRESLWPGEPGDGDPRRTHTVIAPWQERIDAFRASFDLVISHSVLQYLPDVKFFFEKCAQLLRPGGWMSHQIDFASMGVTRRWNGHLAYPEGLWRFIVARRPDPPNRRLVSHYLEQIENGGFDLVNVQRRQRLHGLTRRQVAQVFRSASDDDLQCKSAFIIARKR